MAQHSNIDEYRNAEDAMAAASKMEMHGNWQEAIALHECIAERWPEHLSYTTECIRAMNDKQLLSQLETVDETQPMTVGDWMGTLLILSIPIVNIIMYLVWAFGNSGNVNRKTFCQATLIWFVIILAGVLVFGLLTASFQV
jgi:hypothetical protein